MTTVFRISVQGEPTIVYTATRVGAEEIANIVRNNGYEPTIERLSKMQVPMNEIELVTLL